MSPPPPPHTHTPTHTHTHNRRVLETMADFSDCTPEPTTQTVGRWGMYPPGIATMSKGHLSGGDGGGGIAGGVLGGGGGDPRGGGRLLNPTTNHC
jgi:hypothetical protein